MAKKSEIVIHCTMNSFTLEDMISRAFEYAIVGRRLFRQDMMNTARNLFHRVNGLIRRLGGSVVSRTSVWFPNISGYDDEYCGSPNLIECHWGTFSEEIGKLDKSRFDYTFLLEEFERSLAEERGDPIAREVKITSSRALPPALENVVDILGEEDEEERLETVYSYLAGRKRPPLNLPPIEIIYCNEVKKENSNDT